MQARKPVKKNRKAAIWLGLQKACLIFVWIYAKKLDDMLKVSVETMFWNFVSLGSLVFIALKKAFQVTV